LFGRYRFIAHSTVKSNHCCGWLGYVGWHRCDRCTPW